MSDTGKRITVTEQLLNEISQNIIKFFDPEKIILFGSQVSGKRSDDSDVDLLVIMESHERPARRSTKIRKLCRPKFLPMDILVRTPNEIRKRLEVNDSFIVEILKKGRVLYEKAA